MHLLSTLSTFLSNCHQSSHNKEEIQELHERTPSHPNQGTKLVRCVSIGVTKVHWKKSISRFTGDWTSLLGSICKPSYHLTDRISLVYDPITFCLSLSLSQLVWAFLTFRINSPSSWQQKLGRSLVIQSCLCWQKEIWREAVSSPFARISRVFCPFYEHFYIFFLTWPESVMSKRTVRTLTITFPPFIESLRGQRVVVVNSVIVCQVPSNSERTLTVGVYLDTAGADTLAGRHYCCCCPKT